MERGSLLIKESIEGNEKAFASIVNNYKNYIFAIILNFIKDHGEAFDSFGEYVNGDGAKVINILNSSNITVNEL